MLLAGIAHEYEAVDIFIPLTERSAEFQELTPFGEVPVLVDGAEVLAQSNAILLHLSRKFDAFGATSEAGLNAITSWLFWEANRIGRSYPNHRYCMLFEHSSAPALVDWFEETSIADLNRLETELTDKDFLLGDVTIADISCAAYLLYDDNPKLELAKWPNVSAWLERLRQLPGWVHPEVSLA